MSEPAVDASKFLLDGDLPRLGSATPSVVTPPAPAPEATSFAPPTTRSGPAPILNAPGAAPVLGTPELPTLPTVPTATATAAVHETAPATTEPERGEHPMAHLMPQKSAPSEASRRAAEARAAKKAKARKIKIGVAIGAIVVAAVVGPPLGKWFVNALNDAGSTSTETEE